MVVSLATEDPHPPTPRMGRPPYVPSPEDRENVVILVAAGVEHRIIAKILRVSEHTVQRHFKEELKEGHKLVTAKIGAVLVRLALAGNLGAIRTFLLCRAHDIWRVPKDDQRAFGGDGPPPDNVIFVLPPNGRDLPEIVPDEAELDARVKQRLAYWRNKAKAA